MLDADGEARGSLLGVEQVCLQRRMADSGGAGRRGRRCGLGRVDLRDQVGVPVEEGAVDSGGPGDAARADLLPGGGGGGYGAQDAGAPSGGVGLWRRTRSMAWLVCSRSAAVRSSRPFSTRAMSRRIREISSWDGAASARAH